MKRNTALLLIVLIESGVGCLSWLNYGWSIEGLQAVTRFSGRVSLFLFSFIFLLYPGRKELLNKYLSSDYLMIFALNHGYHLIVLLSYVYLSGIELVPYRLAGGFLAYLLIFLMPWFQYRYESHLIHRRNQRGLQEIPVPKIRFEQLMSVYQFYVWFIFFMTYLSRVNMTFPNAGGSHTEHLILMGWVLVALIIKLFSRRLR